MLSFCDQIQPQLLVDILVSVSRRHPDLPMFDSPDWQATAMAALPPEKQQRRWRPALSSSKPRHGHSLLNSKARHNKGRVTARRPRTVAANTAPKKSPLKRSRLAQEVDNDQENVQGNGVEEEDVEVENPPPPMWPQPGEGLYAKLALETDDRSLLADDNDEEAFSHFLVNKMGRQVDPV